jgi:hypothetical protein
VNFYWGAILGYFLGFAFGVGCALAVMYSIYRGGYRKALQDLLSEEKPERFHRELARAEEKLSRPKS